jgi:hypothetical protein
VWDDGMMECNDELESRRVCSRSAVCSPRKGGDIRLLGGGIIKSKKHLNHSVYYQYVKLPS